MVAVPLFVFAKSAAGTTDADLAQSLRHKQSEDQQPAADEAAERDAAKTFPQSVRSFAERHAARPRVIGFAGCSGKS